MASFRKARKPHVRYVAYALAGAAACVLMAVASVGGAADVAASALGVAPAQARLRPGHPKMTAAERDEKERQRAARVARRTAARRARLGLDTPSAEASPWTSR